MLLRQLGTIFGTTLGKNSGTVFKKNPPLCNAVLAGGGVLLCLVLSVAQTIGDNFWDNIGTNSGTTLKEYPPLCNAVLAGGGVLLCWVLSVAQTITNKTSRGQWKTSTTTKCRFLLSLFSRLCE